MLVALLCGCSVIETVSGIDMQQDNATSDAEIYILPDAAEESTEAGEAAATPVADAQQEAEPSPSPTPLNEGISPTTGRPLPEGAVYRPVLVAIDNAAQSRPQTGLMVADIVYEFPLDREDHSTRYLALFSDTLPARVGPVRTSRAYLADTALEWGGLYVSLGDPEQVFDGYPLLKDSGADRFVSEFLRTLERMVK